jgi:hypothetical protein
MTCDTLASDAVCGGGVDGVVGVEGAAVTVVVDVAVAAVGAVGAAGPSPPPPPQAVSAHARASAGKVKYFKEPPHLFIEWDADATVRQFISCSWLYPQVIFGPDATPEIHLVINFHAAHCAGLKPRSNSSAEYFQMVRFAWSSRNFDPGRTAFSFFSERECAKNFRQE